jgi:ABC-type branched-subunit amino acid transport system substrate-binding protein
MWDRFSTRRRTWSAGIVVCVLLTSCAGGDGAPVDDGAEASTEIVADLGVDLERRVIRIGALNDESGPGAAIGVPWATGKRMLVEQVNAGDSGLLPDGWTLELVERDHGYNPQESVQAFQEIVDDVLFFVTSFGTPNTLPLVDDLQAANVVAFPASLEASFFEIEQTPPLGAPYTVEAHQALDWALEAAGGSQDASFAIVYQADDYGRNVLDGLRAAAAHHGVELVAEVEVLPGETDFTAPVSSLQGAGATHVLLTTLPGGSGGVMGTAAQMGYAPTWLGNTPAWIDDFFNPDVMPPSVYENFRWVTGLPLWGEDVPGMDEFLEAYEAHGAEASAPSFYLLLSYAQARVAVEALANAIEAGDLTRDGFLAAVRGLRTDAAGLFRSGIDLTTFPYAPTSDTRVLKPGEDLTSWEVEREFSTPDSWQERH